MLLPVLLRELHTWMIRENFIYWLCQWIFAIVGNQLHMIGYDILECCARFWDQVCHQHQRVLWLSSHFFMDMEDPCAKIFYETGSSSHFSSLNNLLGSSPLFLPSDSFSEGGYDFPGKMILLVWLSLVARCDDSSWLSIWLDCEMPRKLVKHASGYVWEGVCWCDCFVQHQTDVRGGVFSHLKGGYLAGTQQKEGAKQHVYSISAFSH